MFRTLDSLTLTREARSSAWSSSGGLACEPSQSVLWLPGSLRHHHTPSHTALLALSRESRRPKTGQNARTLERVANPTSETGLPSPLPLGRPESHPSVHTCPSFLYRKGRCSEQRHGKILSAFCTSNTVKSGGVPNQAVSPELSGPESRGERCTCCDTQDTGQWPHRPFL